MTYREPTVPYVSEWRSTYNRPTTVHWRATLTAHATGARRDLAGSFEWDNPYGGSAWDRARTYVAPQYDPASELLTYLEIGERPWN